MKSQVAKVNWLSHCMTINCVLRKANFYIDAVALRTGAVISANHYEVFEKPQELTINQIQPIAIEQNNN
jgi:hypothetical protein